MGPFIRYFVAILAATGFGTGIAAADDVNVCKNASGELAIAVCSTDIRSGKVRGKDLAARFTRRGFLHLGLVESFLKDRAGASQDTVQKYRTHLDLAIADLNQAIALNPSDADAFYNRGEAYQLQAERSDVLDPGNPLGLPLPGVLEAFHRAIADYDQAAKLGQPKAASARMFAQSELASREHRFTMDLPTQMPPRPLAPPTAPVMAERRVALVIGNSAYTASAFLANPRRDAQAVSDALQKTGFQTVVLQTDLGRDKMRAALRSFREAADGADWALIYFAGHGIEIGRVNYLIPIDASLRDERDVKAETVSYDELEETIRGAKALRLIILDACRVDPFVAQMKRTNPDRAPSRGLGPPPEAVPGTLVVYSAKDGEVAEDGDGNNSPFARAFVDELAKPGLEVRRLFDYVRDDVLDATRRRQQPFTYGSLPGRKDFYFVAAK